MSAFYQIACRGRVCLPECVHRYIGYLWTFYIIICVSDFHYKKLHYVFIIISFAFAGGGSGNKIG